jgi:TFIIF-interacting CTD phosphatase-like protein
MNIKFNKVIYPISILTLGSFLGIFSYVQAKKKSSEKINIIFDLDETIIHTDKIHNIDNYNCSNLLKPDINEVIYNDGTKRKIWIRPFVKTILPILSEFNNLYLFTKGTKSYADLVLKKCQLDKYFVIKKYRDDCKGTCKELSKLNIDLDKSILIDDKISNKCVGQSFYHIPRFNYYVKNDFEMIKLFGFVLFLNITNDLDKFIKSEQK